VRELPIGWATDLAVLELTGSTVEEHDGHLIVRTPHNPNYHWGNCIFVTDPGAVDDAERWVREFRATFPAADWISIGLPRLPHDAAAWVAHDLELELDEVLTADSPPRAAPLADGYAVRPLADDDWEQSVALATAENERAGRGNASAYARFARARMETNRGLCESRHGAYFGAFAGSRLVAELGIVRCGSTARYQNVLTDAQHRRRGLATHLLGVAALWAADHDCERWVIVTEATNPAGRVYRSAGLEFRAHNVQAYRRPPQ
jgi:GNAT superfamily N-acetyltransferase